MALIDALVAIDGVSASGALFELVEHKNPAVRSRAAAALAPLVGSGDEDHLLRLASSRRSESRQLAARLLAGASSDPALEKLFELASDQDSAVALAACQSLARQRVPRTREVLAERVLAASEMRSLGYLCIAVTLREEALGEAASDVLEGACLRGVESTDPFAGAACASLLGTLGFRASDASRTGYLETKVVPRLIVAAAGERYFSDFTSVHDLAIRQLQRLTARDFGNDGPAWARWWSEAKANFRANRAAFTLSDPPSPTLAIDVDREGLNFTLRADQAEPGPNLAQQEDFLLSGSELARLVSAIRSSGVADCTVLPGIRGDRSAGTTPRTRDTRDAGASRLWLRDTTQRKPVGRSADASWGELDALIAACCELRRANLWQRYRNPNSSADRDSFLRDERAFLAKETDPAARAARFVDLVSSVFPELPPDRKVVAIADLAESPAVETALDDLAAIRFVPYLAKLEPGSEAAEKLIALTMSRGSLRVVGALVGALDDTPRPTGKSLLSAALARAGATTARELAKDKRAWVRASAAKALGTTAAPEDLAVLRDLLRDSADEVISASASSLGLRRDRESLAALLALESKVTSTTRRAILAALGRIGGDQATEVLLAAATAEEASVRLTAIEAIGELRDARTLELLANHWIHALAPPPGDPTLAEAARDAIIAIGGPRARDIVRRLLDNGVPLVRREAAIALSELADPAAVPALLAEAERSSEPRVRDALVQVTYADYFVGTDPIAKYRDWWAAHRSESPASWFIEACGKAGIAPGLAATSLESRGDSGTILALAEVLERSGDANLSVGAARWLRSLTGRTFGRLALSTPREERVRVASEYRRFAEAQR